MSTRRLLTSSLRHPKLSFSTSTSPSPDPRFLQHNSPIPRRHTPIFSTPLTRITTLPNSLRIATQSNLASPVASVGVWIDAGSRYESEKTNGTAHFLEHMIFKGTEKRTQRELEEEVENIGGHLDAYTSREVTTYYAKVLKVDAMKAVEILSDIVQNSQFEERFIDFERNVILREMLEVVECQTEEVIFDHLHATAFRHTPLGRTILGPVENIKSITRSDLKNYISTHYIAPRMVVIAAGAVEHEELVEQVKKSFTNLSEDATTTAELIAKAPGRFTGSEIRIVDNNVPVAQFAIGFEGASWRDPDSIALRVIQSMLGTWDNNSASAKHMGSELAQRVATDELAESFMSFNTNYNDTGLFGVYAVSQPDSLEDLASAIMNSLSKMCCNVSDEDVIRACNQLKSRMILDLDGTTDIVQEIGSQLLAYGRKVPYAELFARIDAVDASTVKRVASKYILDKDVAIAAMGPIQKLPDYNWFRRRSAGPI